MTLTNQEILNSMSTLASEAYRASIPDATTLTGDNVRSSLTLPQNNNMFMDQLINQVIKPTFLTRRLQNKLKILYRGNLEFGESIHNIFVGMAEAKNFGENFEGCNSELEDMYNKATVNIEQEYATVNFKKKLKVSISQENLAMAFRDAYGLSRLIQDVTTALVNRAEFEELMAMKYVIAKQNFEKETQRIIMPKPKDGQSAKDFAKKLKEMIELLGFPSASYNTTGVVTTSTPRDLILITTPDVKASLDIDLYAGLFNINKAEVESRIITIDNFHYLDDNGQIITNCDRYAMLVDRDFIQFYTKLVQSESIRNPNSLYTNQFMHLWSLLATCNFANAIEFVEVESIPEI